MEKIQRKKITLWTLVLLIFVPTFGFGNITQNAVYLGPAAIPSWIIVALLYFLPLSIIIAELASANKEKEGGLYNWIECGIGEKWAFIGTWSYYIANLFYLQMVFARIPIMISWAIFGENRFSDSQANLLIIFSLVLSIILTFIASKGVDRFSKISDLGGKFTLAATGTFILFAILGPFAGTPSATVFTAENVIPVFDITYFATFSWLLFAVAGAEVAGTYIQDVENPNRTFPKGVLIATALIAFAYIVGSLAVNMIASPEVLEAEGLKNAGYIVYRILADNWGLNGSVIVRIYAAIYTVTSIAAYVIWIESPIRAMFSEVPANTFPAFLMKKKEDGTLVNALWLQCAILGLLIIVPIFGLKSIDSFIELLSNLSALALIIPYLVLGAAYIGFRKKGVLPPFTMIKTKAGVWGIAGIMVFLSVLGFFGAGLDYIVGSETMAEALTLIAQVYFGPFLLIGAGYGLVALNKRMMKEELKDKAA